MIVIVISNTNVLEIPKYLTYTCGFSEEVVECVSDFAAKVDQSRCLCGMRSYEWQKS